MMPYIRLISNTPRLPIRRSKPEGLPYRLLISQTTRHITTKVPISPYPNIVVSHLQRAGNVSALKCDAEFYCKLVYRSLSVRFRTNPTSFEITCLNYSEYFPSPDKFIGTWLNSPKG
jgi:hypothetical protein